MKIGMNMLLWTDTPGTEHLHLLEDIKGWGFDGVELPLDDLSEDMARLYAGELQRLGLEATGIVAMPAEKADPISSDRKLRRCAVEYMRSCIDKAHILNASVIAGPLYQGLGRFSGMGPTSMEKERCVEYLRETAPYAGEKGILLAGEAINRFETYFVNTVEQACEIIDQVDSPYVGIHVDTYHGNMEELDVCRAWRAAGDRIFHVHISENTRGIPGTGNAVFPEIFETLREIGYDRWLTIEGFGKSSRELAARLHLWRPFAERDEDIAEKGYAYIASMIGAE